MQSNAKNAENKFGRRGNNEGSIYQRKDGRWCAQAIVGYCNDGKPNKKYIYGKSRQEVAKKLAGIVNDVFQNGYSSFIQRNTNAFCDIFLEWYETFKEPTIKSSTSAKLRMFMKTQIFVELGNFLIEQIDLFKMQRFFNNLSKNGICLQSQKHIKQLLNQFYVNYALEQKMVNYNPLEKVVIKKYEREDPNERTKALSVEQRMEILSLLENDKVLKPIIVFFMFTGVRPGELLALKWKDVNFKNTTVHIKTATVNEYEFDDSGDVLSKTQVIGNTKTVLSERSFIIPENIIQCLLEWKLYQDEQKNKTNINFTSPDMFIFCTNNGKMRSYSGLRSLLRRFLEKNDMKDLGISLYSFRHTFATILLENRENPKIVSKLMGHSKVVTTLTSYSHIINSDVYKETASVLNEAYSELLKKSNSENKNEPTMTVVSS